MVGDCKTFDQVDGNIKSGIPVDRAIRKLIKAMYLNRKQIVLGGLYYYLTPKIAAVSANAHFWMCRIKYRSQMKMLNKARAEKTKSQ